MTTTMQEPTETNINAELITELRDCVSWSSFAESICEQYDNKKSLSSNQWQAVSNMLTKVKEQAMQKEARLKLQPQALRELRSVIVMMDMAAEKINHPILRVDGYKISRTTERSELGAGQLHVIESSSNIWAGRIDRDGEFKPSKEQAMRTVGQLVETLSALANDPEGYAKAYGQRTGLCCFCGRELTDGRSVDAGYGPVCADNYSLAWGVGA